LQLTHVFPFRGWSPRKKRGFQNDEGKHGKMEKWVCLRKAPGKKTDNPREDGGAANRWSSREKRGRGSLGTGEKGKTRRCGYHRGEERQKDMAREGNEASPELWPTRERGSFPLDGKNKCFSEKRTRKVPGGKGIGLSKPIGCGGGSLKRGGQKKREGVAGGKNGTSGPVVWELGRGGRKKGGGGRDSSGEG